MAHDAFIKFEGIASRIADSGRPGWIRLLAIRHSLDQPMSGSAATGGPVAAARTRHGDMQIHKLVDDISPGLALFCCNGRTIPSATIEIWDASTGRNKFMEYQLSDVLVRSVAVQLPTKQDIAAQPTLWEAVNLQYSRIEWIYTLNDANGPIGSIGYFWDTSNNTGG